MSAIKRYLKQEFQLLMLVVDHPKPSDFYLSIYQTTDSPVPLLILRIFFLLVAVAITLWSLLYYILNGIFQFWFIYLTHWGLCALMFTTGFSVAVSARCYIYGPISADVRLPWYVQIFWVSYNIAVPSAFLITLFYWIILFDAKTKDDLKLLRDLASHALNTILMLLLLATSSHPSRLLHFYQPLLFAFSYIMFGIIYYFAGGTTSTGKRAIYSMVNWDKPGPTIVVVTCTCLVLLLLHLVTVGLAVIRDVASDKWVKPTPDSGPQQV